MPVNWVKRLFTRAASLPKTFPSTGFRNLGHVQKLEEENWEWYNVQNFYPVRLGETFRTRYQVLGKLGYGAHSTAWLCRDLLAHKYLTLKICAHGSSSSRREIAAYGHLDSLTTSNPGALLIRQLHDSFQLQGSKGEYSCLLHEPLGMSVETLRDLMPAKQLPEIFLRVVATHLLQALDCLHRDAHMVHTDLQASNIQLRIEDESILNHFEQQEMTDPSARKCVGERVIYESRELIMPKKQGRPVLCDFGEARFGHDSYSDDIQPYVYRAPEVILGIPWSYPADIWNVGVLIWDLFENKHLFNTRGQAGEQRSEFHLADMVATLGSPPVDLLRRSEISWKYFNADGSCKTPSLPSVKTLESREERLHGQEQAAFLAFVRRMLRWVPEERATARELLSDVWLTA